MKNIITLLLASASLSYGAANDLLIAQRNPTDTGQITRLVANPGLGVNGFVIYDGGTNLPRIADLGSAITLSSNTINVTPVSLGLADVATSADYNDLVNLPSIPSAQVQTDWNAVSGIGVLLNKPTLAAVATSGAYSDLSGRPSLATVATSGDYGDLTNKPTLGTAAAQNSTAFATAAQGAKADSALQPGWTGQNTITTVGTISTGTWQGTAIGDTYISSASTWNGKLSPTGNGSGLTGLTKTQVGLGNVENTALSTWAGSTNITTLGTVSSGTWQGTSIANSYIASAATWNAKFDSPSGSTSQYVRGDGSLATFPSIPSAQIQSDWAQTNNASVDFIKNKPAGPSISNNPSRTIQTVAAAANGWQISSTNTCFVSYSVTITATASGLLAGASTGYVVLETASTNSSTAGNWIEIGRASNGQQINSILTLSSTQPIGSTIAAYIQPGYYLRLRSVNVSGTPSYGINSSQEVIIS